MLPLLIHHIPSTLLHLITGVLLWSLFHRDIDTTRKTFYQGCAGCFIVLLLDLAKLMGLLIFHSVIFVPLLGAGIAFLLKNYVYLSFPRLWIASMTVILFAGIGIDYLGNGVHLFYPFSDLNYSYTVLRHEWPVFFTLSILFLLRFLFQRVLPLRKIKLIQILSLLVTLAILISLE